MTAPLVLKNVEKRVGRELHLAGINLTLAPGSFHVVLGRTLAGKTSLLRVVAGLDRPTSGRILLGGADITRTTVRKRSVAMVYQQFINYPSFTVRDNIAAPLRLQRARDVDARVAELARLLRIEPLLSRRPGELSGGQQQRVAIARALAKGADFVLLDEPLVNLDYKLREELRDELRAILRGRASTVLYATTDPAEALAMGGHTILMHEGRVVQHAPTLDVYHRPATVAAARVFSDPPMNVIDARVEAGAARIAGDVVFPLPAHLRALADGSYRLAIRASDCALQPRAGSAVAMRARVELSEISGSETFVYLHHGDAAFIVQEDGVFHHAEQDELTFYLHPDRLLAFGPDSSPAGDEDDTEARVAGQAASAGPAGVPGGFTDARDAHPLVASYHPPVSG